MECVHNEKYFPRRFLQLFEGEKKQNTCRNLTSSLESKMIHVEYEMRIAQFHHAQVLDRDFINAVPLQYSCQLDSRFVSKFKSMRWNFLLFLHLNFPARRFFFFICLLLHLVSKDEPVSFQLISQLFSYSKQEEKVVPCQRFLIDRRQRLRDLTTRPHRS